MLCFLSKICHQTYFRDRLGWMSKILKVTFFQRDRRRLISKKNSKSSYIFLEDKINFGTVELMKNSKNLLILFLESEHLTLKEFSILSFHSNIYWKSPQILQLLFFGLLCVFFLTFLKNQFTQISVCLWIWSTNLINLASVAVLHYLKAFWLLKL